MFQTKEQAVPGPTVGRINKPDGRTLREGGEVRTETCQQSPDHIGPCRPCHRSLSSRVGNALVSFKQEVT